MKTHGRSHQSPTLVCARELPPSYKRRELAFQLGQYPDLRAVVLHKKQVKTLVRPITKLANSKVSSSFRVSTNIRETRNSLDVKARFPDLKTNPMSFSEERTAPAKIVPVNSTPTPVCFLHRSNRVKSLQAFDTAEKENMPNPRPAMDLRTRLQVSMSRNVRQDNPVLESVPQLSSRSWVRLY